MTITADNLKNLKKAHNEALSKKQEMFQFEGKTLLVTYSKYLIKYMEQQLNIK